MITILPNLLIGAQADCRKGDEKTYVIHACKSPCHQNSVGYRGNLNKAHKNYLFKEGPDDLFLNIVDATNLKYFNRLAFIKAVSEIQTNIQHRNVLIHCNQGRSRSKAIALLYFLSTFSHEKRSPLWHNYENLFGKGTPLTIGPALWDYLIQNYKDILAGVEILKEMGANAQVRRSRSACPQPNWF